MGEFDKLRDRASQSVDYMYLVLELANTLIRGKDEGALEMPGEAKGRAGVGTGVGGGIEGGIPRLIPRW